MLHSSGHNVEEHHNSTTVIYITGPVFFGNAERLSEQVLKELSDSEVVIFSMRGVPMVDTTGTEVVLDLVKACQIKGLTVIFSGLGETVRKRLDSTGLSDLISEDSYFISVDRALLAMS